ncbi:hypothetical protein [Nocardioides sp.]|uniref:hypothetical protein n=1 Tax=Nocardioides sp. TaxID=35761 RepID=UPI003D0BD417
MQKLLIPKLLAAATLATPMLAVAPLPAQAAGCLWDTGNVYSNDYRWVSLNGCSYGRVRHHYDAAWSANNYWTSWKEGASYAQSASSAELYEGQTQIAP